MNFSILKAVFSMHLYICMYIKNILKMKGNMTLTHKAGCISAT